jgi:amino acid adenylation domain-containing protein
MNAMNIYTKQKTEHTQFNLIHQLFEEQVKRSPDQIALICADQRLTYRELNTRANQLARHLQAQGVEPETLIGLYMERSVDIAISILGILKAGCAYVPLDHRSPKERLSTILEDTQIAIILTQTKLIKDLSNHQASVNCIDINVYEEELIPENQELFISQVAPQHLAYVMYTSGSTGKPKGVEMPHNSISNYIQSLNQILEINAEDVYLHTTSFPFSSSMRQLMLPLTVGAKIVMATQEQIKNPLILFELIQKERVTVFDTVQSVWRYILQALEELDHVTREKLLESNLRLLLFSGGLLPKELFQKVRSTVKDKARIVNVYGQTESIGVCAYPIPDGFDQELVYLPIGRPYPYLEVYILDENLQPVPTGEVGEMHVAGAGLARGYLNRPELTQEKFIAHPFSQEPGARLYKTGDLARQLPDGNFECVGRADFQVKIRGIRVELGEIETTILAHPAVQDVVIVTRIVDISGEPSLVAYIVLKPEQKLTNKELRNFIKDKLPDYMIPATFVVLDALPLTPNGKIDRAALPAPDSVKQEANETFVAPRNELEIQLTKIWSKVLGVKSIGIKDNFFEVGGHSLLAVSLFNEIERTVGKNLPLSILLQVQTIEEMAAVLSQEESSTSRSSLVMIQKGSNKKPPLFLTHGIWGNVLFYRDLTRYLEPDQPVYGLQAKGLDGKQAPSTSVQEMAANYIQEIQTIQPQGPYYLGGYSFGGLVVFEAARQLQAQGQETALLVIWDTRAPNIVISTVDNGNAADHTTVIKWKWNSRLNNSFKYLPAKVKWHLTGGKLSIFYRNYLRYIKRSLADIRLLDMNIANSQASRKYLAQVYNGKVTLLRCKPIDNITDFGWGELATDGVDITILPGNHGNIMEDPNVIVSAKQLNLCLQETQRIDKIKTTTK